MEESMGECRFDQEKCGRAVEGSIDPIYDG